MKTASSKRNASAPIVEFQRLIRAQQFGVTYAELAAAIRSLRLIEDAVLPTHRDPQYDPFTDLLWNLLLSIKGYEVKAALGCCPVSEEMGDAA